MSKSSQGIILLRGIESGEKNTTIQISLSNEKTTSKAIPRITGRALISRDSFFTTKKRFNKIKLIDMR